MRPASGRRAFVTGATGFVGSHLVHHLIDSGDAVAVLIRPESDPWRIADVLQRVTPVKGRLSTPSDLRKQLLDFRPDVVFHLGWSGSAPSQRDMEWQLDENVGDGVGLVELAGTVGATTWVGLGSQAEYGPTDQILDESTPTRPVTRYGIAKLAAGARTAEVCAKLSIRHVWLRLLTAYGPADNPTYLIPYVILSLLRKLRPRLTAGNQAGDFLEVLDACTALRLVAQTETCSGTFVLASGDHTPVREVALTIRDIIDPGLEVGLGEVVPEVAPISLRGNPSALQKATGWHSQTRLQTGLIKAIDWYRQNLTRYSRGMQQWS